jgi:hypothetical protein
MIGVAQVLKELYVGPRRSTGVPDKVKEMTMRRFIGALVVLAVIALQSGVGVAAEADKTPPMVFDKKIGYYKDMSYEALSDEGLSWEQRTRLFGGDTATYGPLAQSK